MGAGVAAPAVNLVAGPVASLPGAQNKGPDCMAAPTLDPAGAGTGGAGLPASSGAFAGSSWISLLMLVGGGV